MCSSDLILPDLTIGEEATVGANSAVMENVPAGASALGVPAQMLMTAKSARGLDASDSVPRAVADERTIEAIRQVWQEVLELPEAPTQRANFFDIGGSSLLALQLRARTQEVLGKPVSLLDIFRFPTIERLAASLSNSSSGEGSRGAGTGARRADIRRRRRAQR